MEASVVVRSGQVKPLEEEKEVISAGSERGTERIDDGVENEGQLESGWKEVKKKGKRASAVQTSSGVKQSGDPHQKVPRAPFSANKEGRPKPAKHGGEGDKCRVKLGTHPRLPLKTTDALQKVPPTGRRTFGWGGSPKTTVSKPDIVRKSFSASRDLPSPPKLPFPGPANVMPLPASASSSSEQPKISKPVISTREAHQLVVVTAEVAHPTMDPSSESQLAQGIQDFEQIAKEDSGQPLAMEPGASATSIEQNGSPEVNAGQKCEQSDSVKEPLAKSVLSDEGHIKESPNSHPSQPKQPAPSAVVASPCVDQVPPGKQEKGALVAVTPIAMKNKPKTQPAIGEKKAEASKSSQQDETQKQVLLNEAQGSQPKNEVAVQASLEGLTQQIKPGTGVFLQPLPPSSQAKDPKKNVPPKSSGSPKINTSTPPEDPASSKATGRKRTRKRGRGGQGLKDAKESTEVKEAPADSASWADMAEAEEQENLSKAGEVENQKIPPPRTTTDDAENDSQAREGEQIAEKLHTQVLREDENQSLQEEGLKVQQDEQPQKAKVPSEPPERETVSKDLPSPDSSANKESTSSAITEDRQKPSEQDVLALQGKDAIIEPEVTSGPSQAGDVEEVHAGEGPDIEQSPVDGPRPKVAWDEEEEGQTDVLDPEGWKDARFKQRLWSFLFENLNRSVDELYFLCEMEGDKVHITKARRALAEAVAHFDELSARTRSFEKKNSESTSKASASVKASIRRSSAITWHVSRTAGSPLQARVLATPSSSQGGGQATALRACKRAEGGEAVEPPQSEADSSRANSAPSKFHSTSQPVTQTSPARKPLIKESATTRQAESLKEPPESHQTGDPQAKEPTELTSSAVTKLLAGLAASRQTGLRAINTSREQTDGSIKSASASSTPAWKEKRNWGDILSQQGTPMGAICSLSVLKGFKRAPSAERVKMLHDKLMSPQRRRKTPDETRREFEERQARATRLRNERESERRARLQKSAGRASKVNEWQEIRRTRLYSSMEQRLRQSETRYEAHLAEIVRRAGDESCKVREVHFITSLSKEDKKLQLKQKQEESEARRQERYRSLQRRKEEDNAREEEARERRKQLEAERQKKIAEAQRKKEEAAARREDEKRKELAEREARKEQLAFRLEEQKRAAAEAAELLGQRLAERLKESSLRRKVYLEQIRERAAVDTERLQTRDGNPESPYKKGSPRRPSSREGGRPSTRVSLTEKLSAVSTSISEEKAPVSETPEQVAEENPNSESSKEVLLPEGKTSEQEQSGEASAKEAMKKKAKRIKQRLSAKKHEWSSSEGSGTTTSTGRSKAAKWLLELQRQQARGGSGAGLEAAGNELLKHLEAKESECHAARQAGLLDFTATALVSKTPLPPPRAFLALLRILRTLLTVSANCSYFIARNLLPPLIPLLTQSMARFSGGPEKPSEDSEANNLEGLLAVVNGIAGHNCKGEEKLAAMQEDLVELLVASRLIHNLRDLFALFDCPQAEGEVLPIPNALLGGLQLLETLTGTRGQQVCAHAAPVHTAKPSSALSRATKSLLEVVSETGLIGLPSLLTAVLLHAGVGKVTLEQTAAALPPNFVEVATAVLKVLNNIARLDLKLLQKMLALPDLRVEFFHLVSFLLSHCTFKWSSPTDTVASLLHETLLLLGYFALLHPGNQAVLRWGKEPAILQKLCELPFPYFSDPKLQPLLFGTVLAACYGSDRNRDVVERELSMDMLQTFLRTQMPEEESAPLEDAKSSAESATAKRRASLTSETSKESLSGPKPKAPRVGLEVPAASPKGVGRVTKPGLPSPSPRVRSGAVTPSDSANPSPRIRLAERRASEGVAGPSPRTARSSLSSRGTEQAAKKRPSTTEKGPETKTVSGVDGASGAGTSVGEATGQPVAYLLQNRFPASLWSAAEQFFAVVEHETES